MAVARRMVSISVSAVFMLVLIVSASTFSSCYAEGSTAVIGIGPDYVPLLNPDKDLAGDAADVPDSDFALRRGPNRPPRPAASVSEIGEGSGIKGRRLGREHARNSTRADGGEEEEGLERGGGGGLAPATNGGRAARWGRSGGSGDRLDTFERSSAPHAGFDGSDRTSMSESPASEH
ncbi:hypothetical protein E2562_024309 [Oryza meyeriana var. granulata]|uniref:DUF834 domain-containing protein n=1 Tax=Oryza meyeriana var. granulata TaxID=110450 RepID=A0A6G1C8G6_9ORYZ|nr:hypothetical protein E2562_024309 [Oryza meyeriana var. granulata]